MSLDGKLQQVHQERKRITRELLVAERFQEAYQYIEGLRSSVSIPGLRNYIYDGFMHWKRINMAKATKLANLFSAYEISPWLTSTQI